MKPLFNPKIDNDGNLSLREFSDWKHCNNNNWTECICYKCFQSEKGICSYHISLIAKVCLNNKLDIKTIHENLRLKVGSFLCDCGSVIYKEEMIEHQNCQQQNEEGKGRIWNCKCGTEIYPKIQSKCHVCSLKIEILPLVSKDKKSSSRRKREDKHFNYTLGMEIKGYKVVKCLGEGTFGRVLEVEKEEKTFALKIIRTDNNYADLAKEEALLVNALNQKDDSNIIVNVEATLNFMIDKQKYFGILFEKLGSSLSQILKENNEFGMPIFYVQKVAKFLFRGLEFIHKLGVTHTDIKPDNIVLADSRSRCTSKSRSELKDELTLHYGQEYCIFPTIANIKIIDFGSAMESHETHSGIINTRQYRAPEVVLGCCDWDTKSDIWCAASSLVELYSGKLLFPLRRNHDDVDQLFMVSKIIGCFPEWMLEKTTNKTILEAAERNDYDRKRIADVKSLDDTVSNKDLLDFFRYLLEIDPKKRPSATEILNHKFLTNNI